jgi:hypothetical protein
VGLAQQWFGTITILDIGGMNVRNQEIAFRVNREMTLASIDLFAAIKATFAAPLCRLDRLTIDHDRGWFLLTPLRHTNSAAQAVVDLEQGAVLLPLIEIVANSPGRREIEWDQTPLAASSLLVHQGIEYAAQIDGSRATRSFLR